MDKKKLKEHLIDVHQHIIEDLGKEIGSYSQGADLDEEDTLDPEDYSHQTEAGNIAMNLKQQLKQAESELRFLESLDDSAKDEVGPGALVQLDDRYLYISIATLPFEHEGAQIISISTEAPIYPLIKFKHKGDHIKLGKTNHEIIEIY
ncbi:MAG: hypothetical protein HKN45_04895 [Flavobacteriales bacterium]|nr:hypothetical protein [Flavobacteriales bacterium]